MSTPKKITKKQMKSVKAGQAIPMANKTNLKKGQLNLVDCDH